MQKFIMKKSALSYCTVMVNMRSALAEHGEEVAGRYILLCLYCAEQVNSGVIENCGEWSARQWMIRVGIDDRPEDIPGLWHWEDGDLMVDGYNTNGEAMALAKRQKGRDAANARWGNASSDAPEDNAHLNAPDGIHDASSNAPCNTTGNSPCNAQSIPSSNAHCNTKERKGKERREEGGGEYELQGTDDSPHPTDSRKARIGKAWNPEFIAFGEWVRSLRPGWDLGAFTVDERDVAIQAFESLTRPMAADDMQIVSEYFAKEPDNSNKFDYPPERKFFLKRFTETVQLARVWWKKSGWKTQAQKMDAGRRKQIKTAQRDEFIERAEAQRLKKDPEELIRKLGQIRTDNHIDPLTDMELEEIRAGRFVAA